MGQDQPGSRPSSAGCLGAVHQPEPHVVISAIGRGSPFQGDLGGVKLMAGSNRDPVGLQDSVDQGGSQGGAICQAAHKCWTKPVGDWSNSPGEPIPSHLSTWPGGQHRSEVRGPHCWPPGVTGAGMGPGQWRWQLAAQEASRRRPCGAGAGLLTGPPRPGCVPLIADEAQRAGDKRWQRPRPGAGCFQGA